MTDTRIRLRSSLLLMSAALIWGFSFVAQSVGMKQLDPMWFNGMRMTLGGLALIPYVLFRDKKKKAAGQPTVSIKDKTLLKGGIVCGTVLCVASAFQNYGIIRTTVGKSGFLTALYVLLVPILGGIFFRKKTPLHVWICVGVAIVGMYFLCLYGSAEGTAFNTGDLLMLACAVVFALHFHSLDRFSPQTDSVKLSMLQFLVCGVLSFIAAPFFAPVTAEGLKAALIPILYSGILSTSVAFTFQAIAQSSLDPTVASIICSLESVFALIGGILLLHEIPTLPQAIGCVLMFAAIVAAQIPGKKKQEAV